MHKLLPLLLTLAALTGPAQAQGELEPVSESEPASESDAASPGYELGSYAAGWLGLGTTGLNQDARAADASGSSFDLALGVDVRLAAPDRFPLAALLAYEAAWGVVGFDDREVLDRRGEGEWQHEAHLGALGLGPAILAVPRVVALYPYASYTLFWQRIDRDEFDPNRRSPIPLRGFESHDRIFGHGPGAGLQLAFRFGSFGGLDFDLSYAYLFDVEVDQRSDLVSGLDPFETQGHAIRMVTSLWFRLSDRLTIGIRLGSGFRYLRKESERQGGVEYTYPDTYLSPTTFGFLLRLRF